MRARFSFGDFGLNNPHTAQEWWLCPLQLLFSSLPGKAGGLQMAMPICAYPHLLPGGGITRLFILERVFSSPMGFSFSK